MAKIERYIPKLLRCETGEPPKSGEDARTHFERSRRKGFVVDSGGATQSGLTLTAFRTWAKKKGWATLPDVAMLKAVSYEVWRDVLKEDYWNRCKADEIVSQSVAELLVDFAYNSGSMRAIKTMQAILGVTRDGIIGPKTLQAINGRSPLPLFGELKQRRIAFLRSLKTFPKYGKGWLSRVDSFVYSEKC